jgi:ABC-type sugar transport system substrate-binding protein
MSNTGRSFARTGVMIAVAASALLTTALPASAAADKVTICHATGSATNPYVVITPSAAGVYNGHYRQHDDLGQGDIIPTFTYNGVTYPAKNGGQAAIDNGCKAPIYVDDDPTS